VTSSWFFLSTLNYNARSTTHQLYVQFLSSWCWTEKPSETRRASYRNK